MPLDSQYPEKCQQNSNSNSAGHDVECIVLKIYRQFSRSAKKVEALKEFREFTVVQYKQILRHVHSYPYCLQFIRS